MRSIKKIIIFPLMAVIICLAACGSDSGGDDPYIPGANADLSALSVDGGTLSPAFDAAITEYSVSAANAVTSVTVTGTKADANARVSDPVILSNLVVDAAQTATITVTAQSGATKVYTVTVVRETLLVLKTVPAGSFQRDYVTANISTISTAFRMSEKEITRAQFTAVTGLADPSDTVYSSGTGDPVQMVNWYHALVFCNKLSIAEGLIPVYSIKVSGADNTNPSDWGAVPIDNSVPATNAIWNAARCDWSANGYRLPTEMEWMWAAMGAASGSGYTGPAYLTGYAKPFAGSNSIMEDGSGGSNLIGDYAWTSENAGTTTHPAGTRTANELGLYDMSGNVWEWCWDYWYHTYPSGTLVSDAPDNSGRGPASGTLRVVRGGSFQGDGSFAAVGYRAYYAPYDQGSYFGFRVVRRFSIQKSCKERFGDHLFLTTCQGRQSNNVFAQ